MNTCEIILEPIDQTNVKSLAEDLTLWQQTPAFMRFLKETPGDLARNLMFLSQKVSDAQSGKAVFNGIKTSDDLQRFVGYIMIHNFDKLRRCLELSFRIAPDSQRHGICTQAVKQSLIEAFELEGVDRIEGWHSAFNLGSFGVFKKAGFHVTNFVPRQTFLPNLGQITDDFRWEICRALVAESSTCPLDSIHPQIAPLEKTKICKGMMKHKIV